MHRPVFGESTIRDNTVYRIDYEIDDVEGETRRFSVSPKASSVAPPPPSLPPSRYGHHGFAETLPLSSRR